MQIMGDDLEDSLFLGVKCYSQSAEEIVGASALGVLLGQYDAVGIQSTRLKH
jgi:hypothetical protein